MLPQDSKTRKDMPMARGLLDYFPDALAAVSEVSMKGAKKHGTFDPEGNPTWDKTKSTDHADCILRHLADRGQYQPDKTRHSAALAWRALALLQMEIEADKVQVAGTEQFAAFEQQYKTVNGAGAAALSDEKVEWAAAAAEAFSSTKGPVYTGLDLAKDGSDKTSVFVRQGRPDWSGGGKIVVLGDSYLTLSDVSMLLGIPLSRLEDGRPPAIPKRAYWCKPCNTFHGSNTANREWAFREDWYKRRSEFPQSRDEMIERLKAAGESY